jgi:ankyrin repeat protein
MKKSLLQLLKLSLILQLSACSLEQMPLSSANEGLSEALTEQALSEEFHNNDWHHLDSYLTQGGDINYPIDGSNTPLQIAVKLSHLEIIKLLLAKGAQVNLLTPRGQTALQLTSNLHVARLLLENGADPNLSRQNIPSAFESAISTGNMSLVKLMLSHGARLQASDRLNFASILFRSSEPGMLKLLLEAGARPGGYNEAGTTLLHEAVDLDLIRLLVAKGHPVDELNKLGQTPLHTATSLEKAQALHQLGADLFARDANGSLALHTAATEGRHEIVRYLIEQTRHSQSPELTKIWFNQANDLGNTPLHEAVRSGSPETVRLLMDQGVLINLRNRDQISPLMLTASQNSPAIALKLLKAGADPNLIPKAFDANTLNLPDYTLLLTAVRNRNLQFLEALLKNFINPNQHDKKNNNALHLAIANQDTNMIRLLAVAGTDPNFFNQDGMTPFQMLVRQGDLENIKLLMEKGADLNLEDTKGFESCLEIAASLGRLDIVRYMVENGKLLFPQLTLRSALAEARIRPYPALVSYLMGELQKLEAELDVRKEATESDI